MSSTDPKVLKDYEVEDAMHALMQYGWVITHTLGRRNNVGVLTASHPDYRSLSEWIDPVNERNAYFAARHKLVIAVWEHLFHESKKL